MDASNVLDRYPWAANHEIAVRTTAAFLGLSLETVLKEFDQRILNKVARDQLYLPMAA